MKQKNREVVFSIELKSKEYLKTVKMANGKYESVLVEGTIGQLEQTRFDEGIVLEVKGDKGILRIDLPQCELHLEHLVEVKK